MVTGYFFLMYPFRGRGSTEHISCVYGPDVNITNNIADRKVENMLKLLGNL